MKEEKGNSTLVNQRECGRFSYLQDLTINLEGTNQQIKPRTLDISPLGMFINTEYLVPEGSILDIRFSLPITRHKISTRAEVRYSLPSIGIGIRFINLSSEDQDAINREMIVAGFDPFADSQTPDQPKQS